MEIRGGGLEYLHCSPASRRRRRIGTRCLWVKLGHPVDIYTGTWFCRLGLGPKAGGLALKKLFLRNPRRQKLDDLLPTNGQIRHTILRAVLPMMMMMTAWESYTIL
jgi:hypothetical protein